MLKNMKIGTKLILIGIIILIIPIATLGIIATQKSSQGLQGIVNEQLTKRTSEISTSIYNVLDTEKKTPVIISKMPQTKAVFTDGITEAEKAERIETVNGILRTIMEEKMFAEDFLRINIVDKNGNIIASSSPDSIGTNVSDRDYFKNAIANKVNISDPILSKTTGEPFFSIAAPVLNEKGKVSGATVVMMNIDFLWRIIKDSTIAETGYTYVTASDGTIIAHPIPDLIFTNSMHSDSGLSELLKLFESGRNDYVGYVYDKVAKTAGFAQVPETKWGVFLTVTNEEYLEAAIAVRNAILIVATISFIIALIMFMLFSKTLTKPIQKGVQFAQEISEGKLYTDIDVNQKDEIGLLADALKVMKAKLREVVSNVYNSSIQVSEGSAQLAQSAEQLSQGSTEQAANAEEVSSSVEQMGANIQQNTDNAAQTEKISSQAAIDAEAGGAAVLGAVQAMNEIAEKINIVGEIARQTNMLSLNAAIEAARAGEHGKGFAVVASEVGKLAATSQRAATEILELATQSVNKANAAGEKINAIVPDIRRTADLVSEISASSLEQNSGAAQINEAMLQLDQVIQQNAASAEEASSMSEELTSQAEQLKNLISYFRMEENGKINSESTGRNKIKKIQVNTGKKSSVKNIQTKIEAPKGKIPKQKIYTDENDSDFVEF